MKQSSHAALGARMIRERFEREGWALVQRFLTPREVEALRSATEKLAAKGADLRADAEIDGARYEVQTASGRRGEMARAAKDHVCVFLQRGGGPPPRSFRPGYNRSAVANESNDLLKRILQEVLDSRRVLGEGIEEVGGRLDSFRNETLTNFDAAFLRFGTVESELHAVSAALTRMERSFEGEHPHRELLRAEIQILKDRLAALEKRLANLDGDSADPH